MKGKERIRLAQSGGGEVPLRIGGGDQTELHHRVVSPNYAQRLVIGHRPATRLGGQQHCQQHQRVVFLQGIALHGPLRPGKLARPGIAVLGQGKLPRNPCAIAGIGAVERPAEAPLREILQLRVDLPGKVPGGGPAAVQKSIRHPGLAERQHPIFINIRINRPRLHRLGQIAGKGDHRPFLHPDPNASVRGSIAPADHGHQRHGAQGQKHHRLGRPLPLQHIFHPALRVILAKGQGRCRRKPPLHGKVHQGPSVARLGPVSQRVQHRLVAAHLHIPATQGIAQPHRRVPPIHRQQQIGQRLDQIVPAAEMHALVAEHVGPLVVVQMEGDIDGGPHKPQHKGGGGMVAFIKIPLPQHGGGHLPAQPEIGPHAIRQQHRQPHQPDYRPDAQGQRPAGQQRLRVRRSGKPRLHRRVPVRRHVPRGPRRPAGRAPIRHRAAGLRHGPQRTQIEHTPNPGKRHRAGQPEPDHRPKIVPISLGCPPQQPPRRQHRPHHRQGGKAHGQQPGKHGKKQPHLHPS